MVAGKPDAAERGGRGCAVGRPVPVDDAGPRSGPEAVEQLGEVDVTGVEPMTAVIPNHQRLRDDVVNADPLTGGDIRDKVLANAPAKEGPFFGVPKVIE